VSATLVRLFPGIYVDSVVQLSGTRAMRAVDGVEWAAAGMATPANLDILAEQGFNPHDWSGSGANDLVMAVRAADDEVAPPSSTAAAPATRPATGPRPRSRREPCGKRWIERRAATSR
jgi:FdrA protein